MNKLSAKLWNSGLSLLFLFAAAAHAAPQKDVMLVLDNSGSMRKNDPQFLAKGAVTDFINTLDENYRAGVIIFDEDVKQTIPLMVVDDATKSELIKSLDNVNYRGQLTDSPAAVERAIYELKSHPREGADQFIIFMTDGIVDTGKPEVDIEKTIWLRDELAVDAADNGIKVFAIAFTENADFFLIQSLAKKSGGEYFRAMAPSDLGDVFSAVSEKLNFEPAPEPEPIPEPEPEPEPELPVEDATVVTPLPAELSPEEMSPADFLATLSADERLALEGIAAETGIPMEQLAQELVGSPPADEGGVGLAPPNVPEVTFPDEEPMADDTSFAMMPLLGAAAILLLLVGAVVWFVMRGRSAKQTVGPESDTPSADVVATSSELIVPEAYINDVHGYTDHQSFRLNEKPMMVGRVAGLDTEHLDYLVVNKGTVGRRHAVVKFKDYSFWIVDQGSVNGTFVNGERISGEHQLKHGDKIRFHKYDFDFSQPDMDDGFHTVFADPNPAEATIVATAATLAATSAMELAAHIDEARGGAASPSVDSSGPAAAFADADIFDLIGDSDETSSSPQVLDATDENISAADLEDFENAVDPDDDEELGVEINLDTVGAEDDPSLALDSQPFQDQDDFDAEASAFFEDLTVGPTPDDEAGPSLDGDGMFDVNPEQVSLDEKLEKASAILDSQADENDVGELDTVVQEGTPKLDDPNDLTLEEFLETDSFDAPPTIPPGMPKPSSADEDDVTLEAFISTSLFEGGTVKLTNEDGTILPFQVPDEPNAGMDPGETVQLPRRQKFDGDEGDGDSEDPTILR